MSRKTKLVRSKQKRKYVELPELPYDCLLYIFSYLWEQHLRKLEIVCKEFKNLLRTRFIKDYINSFEIYIEQTNPNNIDNVFKITNCSNFKKICITKTEQVHYLLVKKILDNFKNLEELDILHAWIDFDFKQVETELYPDISEKNKGIINEFVKAFRNLKIFRIKTIYKKSGRNFNCKIYDGIFIRSLRKECDHLKIIYNYPNSYEDSNDLPLCIRGIDKYIDFICFYCKKYGSIHTADYNTKLKCHICGNKFCEVCAKTVLAFDTCYERNPICYGCSCVYHICGICKRYVNMKKPNMCSIDKCKNIFFLPERRVLGCIKCHNLDNGYFCKSCCNATCGGFCNNCGKSLCKYHYKYYGQTKKYKVCCESCLKGWHKYGGRN
jgi:hypothetical protein